VDGSGERVRQRLIVVIVYYGIQHVAREPTMLYPGDLKMNVALLSNWERYLVCHMICGFASELSG
jgi:hypothetical protein